MMTERAAKPKAKQVPMTGAKAQTHGGRVKVNLEEIEEAMMREMERMPRNGKTD